MVAGHRISIVGNSGSGKSTLARALADKLSVSLLELDSLAHQAGWEMMASEEMRERVKAFLAANDAWVIDGNYGAVIDLIWSEADRVVWLDPERAEMMRALLGRTVKRILRRTTLWNGNRERVANLLSLDPERSIVVWAWRNHSMIRQRYRAASDDPRWPDLEFVRLGSRRETTTWLAKQGET